jgi:hypothetical protein
MPKRDYSICEETQDARHVPRDGHPDAGEGFLTIECAACGQTTGYPIPPLDDITWD